MRGYEKSSPSAGWLGWYYKKSILFISFLIQRRFEKVSLFGVVRNRNKGGNRIEAALCFEFYGFCRKIKCKRRESLQSVLKLRVLVGLDGGGGGRLKSKNLC